MFERGNGIVRRIISLLLHQHNVGAWWGGFKNVAGGAGIYITIINLMLITVTAYATTIAPWTQSKGLNISFIAFLGVILVVILLILAFEYKVSIPSTFQFTNIQWWQHKNPMRKEMVSLRKQLKGLKKDIDDLKSIIEELRKDNE